MSRPSLSYGIVTQARIGSTRLPAKVLKNLAGRTVLELHLERLRAAGAPIFVATTLEPESHRIVEICQRCGVPWFRGSTEDVLDRYYQCAKNFELDVIVRVTSDCPLIDGDLVAQAMAEYDRLSDPQIYLSNGLKRTFPRGFDFEVFSFSLLEQAHRHADKDYEREHVTPFLYSGHDISIKLIPYLRREDRSRYRITLDTTDDLELIKTLVDDFGCADKNCEQIIEIMDNNPHLGEINKHVEQKKLGE